MSASRLGSILHTSRIEAALSAYPWKGTERILEVLPAWNRKLIPLSSSSPSLSSSSSSSSSSEKKSKKKPQIHISQLASEGRYDAIEVQLPPFPFQRNQPVRKPPKQAFTTSPELTSQYSQLVSTKVQDKKKYDAAVCYNLLQALPLAQHQYVFNALSQTLKPGGRLFWSFPVFLPFYLTHGVNRIAWGKRYQFSQHFENWEGSWWWGSHALATGFLPPGMTNKRLAFENVRVAYEAMIQKFSSFHSVRIKVTNERVRAADEDEFKAILGVLFDQELSQLDKAGAKAEEEKSRFVKVLYDYLKQRGHVARRPGVEAYPLTVKHLHGEMVML